MVRSTMEAHARTAVGEQWSLGEAVYPAGQIACTQHGGDAGDVGLERQREQVVVEPDVLVEIFGNAGRKVDRRHFGRRLRGQLKASLDLANLFGVLVDGSAVCRAKIVLQTLQLADERVQNAAPLHETG